MHSDCPGLVQARPGMYMAVNAISMVMAHNTSKTINKFNIVKFIGARYYNTNET